MTITARANYNLFATSVKGVSSKNKNKKIGEGHTALERQKSRLYFLVFVDQM